MRLFTEQVKEEYRVDTRSSLLIRGCCSHQLSSKLLAV